MSKAQNSQLSLDAMEKRFIEVGRQGGNCTYSEYHETETCREEWLALRERLQAAGRLSR